MESDMKNGVMDALGKDRAAFEELAKSGEAQQLMKLIRQQSTDVEGAAKKAVKGDMTQLKEILQGLVSSADGADLVNRISQKAKKTSEK